MMTWRRAAILCLVLISTLFGANRVAISNIEFTDELFANVLARYDNEALQRVKLWQSLVESNRGKAVEDQLFAVNRFFNRVNFVDDIEHWRENDYWATPVEFLATNAGDCEDFTIAKYFTLVEMGIDAKKLRMMYVTSTRPRQAHMVLAYYPSAQAIPLVLDNINKRILPANQRRDLIPIYSFNGDGLWLAKEQGRGRRIQSNSNNSLWVELNERMKQGH